MDRAFSTAAVADLDAGTWSSREGAAHAIDGGPPGWSRWPTAPSVSTGVRRPDDDADLTFHLAAADAEAVARGEPAPLSAFQAGRLRIGGDLPRLAGRPPLFARFPRVEA